MQPDERLTGDASVDAATGMLEGLEDQPVREHVAVFEAIQGALADRLAETN